MYNIRWDSHCAETIPQPEARSFTFGSTSLGSVRRHAGRIDSVNQMRFKSRINAMSFFRSVSEYSGCFIISWIWRFSGRLWSSSIKDNYFQENAVSIRLGQYDWLQMRFKWSSPFLIEPQLVNDYLSHNELRLARKNQI